jgi:hypothetical protein
VDAGGNHPMPSVRCGAQHRSIVIPPTGVRTGRTPRQAGRALLLLNKRRYVAVGARKKSAAVSCVTLFAKYVRQVGERGRRPSIYFATLPG